jgi:hypothetical protein
VIRPLDLQMLYMNLDKVGKEQANTKEAQAQAQANQVQRLQKEHDQGQHAVGKANPSTEAEGDPSVKVQADGSNPQQDQSRPGKRKKDEPEKDATEPGWTDPELGKHVDVSG